MTYSHHSCNSQKQVWFLLSLFHPVIRNFDCYRFCDHPCTLLCIFQCCESSQGLPFVQIATVSRRFIGELCLLVLTHQCKFIIFLILNSCCVQIFFCMVNLVVWWRCLKQLLISEGSCVIWYLQWHIIATAVTLRTRSGSFFLCFTMSIRNFDCYRFYDHPCTLLCIFQCYDSNDSGCIVSFEFHTTL